MCTDEDAKLVNKLANIISEKNSKCDEQHCIYIYTRAHMYIYTKVRVKGRYIESERNKGMRRARRGKESISIRIARIYTR